MRESAAGFLVAVAALNALAGSPAEAVVAAYRDAARLPPDAAAHARYLALFDVPEKDRPLLIRLVRYQLNAVSTESDLVQPVLAAPDLLRFDVRDPGPAFTVAWEKTADVDPIFHLQVEVEEATAEEIEIGHYEDAQGRYLPHESGMVPPGGKWVKTGVRKTAGKKVRRGILAAETIDGCPLCRGWLPTRETAALSLLTQSRSPVLSAQWWWARASRQLPLGNREDGTGYYDWLGVKSRDDFFGILRFREVDSLALGKIVRAAVEAGDSGVAQNGRQVERLQGPAGPVWFTLDVDAPDGDRNPTHQLKRGELNHQAEEYYAMLPNGLPGLLLCKADGTLQPTAPDFIGGNGSPGYGGRDDRIHVSLACSDCHGKDVLRPIDDWVRKTFTGPLALQSPDYQTTRDFRRELFSDLEKQRTRDAAAFIDAMETASGLKVEKLTAAINERWRLYANTSLTVGDYGRLLGSDGKTLTASLRAYQAATGGVDPVFAPLLADKPGTISRQSAEEFYPLAQTILRSNRP